MPMLKEKWEALSPKTKVILQVVVGLIIAAGCGYFLTRPHDPNGGFFDLNILIAAGIVLIIPRVLEVQTGDPLKIMRKVMLFSLLAVIVAFVVYGMATGKFAGPLINPPSPSPAASPAP